MRSLNTGYLERLDHLRLLAVIMVMRVHVGSFSVLPDNWYLPILKAGATGVALFMVISGFILAHICGDKEIQRSKFYLNRVLRIYPLLIFFIAFNYFVSFDPRPAQTGILFYLVLLPFSNLYRGFYGEWAGQFWSVAVEDQFYLVFPFLRQSARNAKYYIPAALVGCMALRAAVWFLVGTAQDCFWNILGSLDFFLVGMWLGMNRERLAASMPGWGKHPLTVIGVFAAVNLFLYAAIQLPEPWRVLMLDAKSTSPLWIIWPALEAIAFAALIFSWLESRLTIPRSALLARWGAFSYSSYVWHSIVIACWHKARLECPGWMSLDCFVLIAVVPPTLLLAWASYNLIEKPFLAFRVKYVT